MHATDFSIIFAARNFMQLLLDVNHIPSAFYLIFLFVIGKSGGARCILIGRIDFADPIIQAILIDRVKPALILQKPRRKYGALEKIDPNNLTDNCAK